MSVCEDCYPCQVCGDLYCLSEPAPCPHGRPLCWEHVTECPECMTQEDPDE